ncbi:tetratricopeptide repeat protein [Corynebacterium pseudopelargi]|uniref:Tetratricopeptide repeat protein n=1 Tax=Corynebacterium pseudopelargi TaxID=2080757 RepID=A0A3G6IUD5_9CORY|nr:tetratricopeptide repeat protein [Corynebacterium pseudopelargi]AZA09359.1 Tetratricopeptide repeat protein [Corynebacterium pseudopelargi]
MASEDRGNHNDRPSRGHNQRGGGPKRRFEKPEREDRYRGDRRKDQDDRRGGARGGRRKAQEGDRPKRQHAQRGGSDRKTFGPQRSGFREERLNKRMNEPHLPGDIDVRDLDPMVLQDLKVLSKDNANVVAQHMIMAATLMQDDPELALKHARAAKDRAGRVAVVRETLGIAAYHAGEWKEALSELRAARRMSGGPGLVAVMADAERGLGRPEKAIEVAKEVDQQTLDLETRIELGIVAANARLDLGQPESALVTLQRLQPSKQGSGLSAARLSYAYADVLLANGNKDEALEWFKTSAEQDVDEVLDASERIEALHQDDTQAPTGEEQA